MRPASSSPTVLVTGATGFVGAALTRQLVEEGAAVRIFRRPTSRLDLLGAAADDVAHATGELNDALSLRQAMKGVERVYHAAALVSAGRRVSRETLRRVNVQGTANVVNAALAAGVRRFVLTSSMAALGRPDRHNRNARPINEETPWSRAGSRSDYAISKRDAELEVHRGIAEGLDAVIVNPALVFGVGRAGENTRRLVDAVRRGRLPAVPIGGTCVADVEDVAEGHRRAMRLGETGERYFLGGENLSWRVIFETLAEPFGAGVPRRTLSPRLARAAAAASEALASVTRTRPLLTREAARSTAHFFHYDNRKAVRDLGCAFRPFSETARRIAEALSAA